MWLFNNKEFVDDIDPYEGFVYLITNIVTGRKYIGKKGFWSKRKDKVTNRRKTKESDWKKYYGSSADVKADLKIHGKENFKREILYLCYFKREMTYWETHEQFARGVLLTNDYYNTNIMGKFFEIDSEKFYKKSVKTSQQ